MDKDRIKEAVDRAFSVEFEDYDTARSADVIETNDGEFFDSLDEAFGIIPRTDKLKEDAGK